MSDSSNISADDSGVLTPDDGRTDSMKKKSRLSVQEYLKIRKLFSSKVDKRVEFLTELQKQFDMLQAEYFVEQSLLGVKYEKLYEEFYQKRYEIVNGIKDVEETNEADKVMNSPSNSKKGIPKFWLTAMMANEKLAELITEDDKGALKYLKDIKTGRIDDFKGFRLKFFFSPNPYFKNSVLEKTYMIDRAGPPFMKAKGTEIEWLPRKCLTSKVLHFQKMPRKRSNNDKPLTNTEKCKSFFNFFNPPLFHHEDDNDEDDEDDNDEDDNDEDGNDEDDEDDNDEDENDEDDDIGRIVVHIEGIQKDYELGCVIRDQIIPQAVTWFVGKLSNTAHIVL